MSDNGDKLDNGRLAVIETRIKELEPDKDNPDVRKELTSLHDEKIKLTVKQEPVTDFKVAEIWIRSGQIMLDASESFWSDRCRALGVLEFCKEIVKTAQAPKKQNVIIPGNGKMMRFARNIFNRRK